MNCNDFSFRRGHPAPHAPQMEVASPCHPPRPPYLMQRILASGQTHHRCQFYPLCLENLPPCTEGPFTLNEAFLCGPPQWREDSKSTRDGLNFCVSLPVCLRIRDGHGSVFSLRMEIEEPLRLRMDAPPRDAWRGSVNIQAAVRPASRCGCLDRGSVGLEVLIQGFLLCPCPTSPMDECACRTDPRPWYPQPIRNSFWE